MKSFRSIEELLKVLGRVKELLKEMFAKRKSLSLSSAARYDAQCDRFRNMRVTDSRLQLLVDLIHECHRGYDQEGFIE